MHLLQHSNNIDCKALRYLQKLICKSIYHLQVLLKPVPLISRCFISFKIRYQSNILPNFFNLNDFGTWLLQ